jgi:hypothetical protein
VFQLGQYPSSVAFSLKEESSQAWISLARAADAGRYLPLDGGEERCTSWIKSQRFGFSSERRPELLRRLLSDFNILAEFVAKAKC